MFMGVNSSNINSMSYRSKVYIVTSGDVMIPFTWFAMSVVTAIK